MEVTKKNVQETADLLNIHIRDDEIDALTKSFVNLIDYFSVLDKAVLDIVAEEYRDNIFRVREGEVDSYPNPEKLIARSEEHEDNYVVIPNIL